MNLGFFRFSFHYPLLLALLVVPLLLLIWVWRRNGTRVVLPLDGSSKGRIGWAQIFLHLAESIPAFLLMVTIIILAGPQQLGEPKSKRVLTNIEFCVDVSGSMTATFGEGTRYDASMKAIDDFLNYREGDAFGLTFFGNEVLHWVPLTSDVTAIRCAPPFMNPRNPRHPPWMGGTAIGKALEACRVQLLQREEGDRMIVLVSDGYSSDLSGGNDMTIGKKLTDSNIIVYGVHIGGGEAPPAVMNITGLTGGEVFAPGDTDGLKAVFKRIDDMQETRMEKSRAETMDDFLPWSILGLSLAGLGTVCLFGMRFTPW